MGLRSYFRPAAKAVVDDPQTESKHAPSVEPPRSHPLPSVPSSGGLSQLSGSSRDSSSRFVLDIRFDIIVNYLYQNQCTAMWIDDTSGITEGVIVKRAKNSFLCCPPQLATSSFAGAMEILNVRAAMTVKSRVVSTFVARAADATEIPIRDGLRIQVIRSMPELARARKHQYAAFVAQEQLLVVWDDDPSNLIKRVENIESDLLRAVWLTSALGYDEKEQLMDEANLDPETGLLCKEKRPTMLYNAFLAACSLCLIMVLLGLGYQKIAQEVSLLHRYTSIAFLALTPVNFFLTLFFTYVVISILAQILGPVRHLQTNSRFFSAVCSPRLQTATLPHVTIQCPVYKEGLASVIEPTVRSIKQAISTYELQGGTANILIHDDGMQIISEEDRQARIEFYTDNNIGWTARPAHDPKGLKGEAFTRKGKFKKASNMNFGLAICNQVEERLQLVERTEKWSVLDEEVAYENCLKQVLAMNRRAWAQGNIRIGDYILLIDSDTRVPADCFLDAVSEMEQSPNVAILQFSSGVMQVANDFFENGITFFTNMIYSAIRFGVGAGDVAPFVGHNAMLRWSAVQQVSFADNEGNERFWSETSVSEDFDMALRLQVEGYIVRLAAWAGDGFKEGVSLTVYDELTRWEKYAYGCDELVFNPIVEWIYRGPFTPLFRRFICSSMPLGSKLNITAYIGTYYAIGSAWIMTLCNYLAVGLYNGYLDKWYVPSWQIWLSIIAVFSLGGNVALAVQRYRLHERSFFGSLVENFSWCLMFVIFFGGLSMHVSQAIMCHMFGIDMQWGATAKEVTRTNFFVEVPKVARKFKYSMGFCTLLIIAMIIMATAEFIPWSWNITQFVAIFPLAMLCSCHILMPIVLNPGLMTFTF